ncbi:hypothetical protein H5410_024426 [Solanum commersonii]|uniref:Uncharacterized protein n=1 Tax=Solanum commersonii TaxID=4109 RepID=A0A9J5ZLX0_SOLCO|nr:hypothetical protein H5410_024426 [Solanum commersonii]
MFISFHMSCESVLSILIGVPRNLFLMGISFHGKAAGSPVSWSQTTCAYFALNRIHRQLRGLSSVTFINLQMSEYGCI